MNDDYRDIINLPHHRSTKRKHMSLHDRAAQFAPFAALRGYDEEITETARTTDARIELSVEEIEELNDKLNSLIADIKQKPKVSITYFKPDEKKSGGAYVTIKGNLRRIDEVEKIIIFTDEKKIRIDDVYDITVEE